LRIDAMARPPWLGPAAQYVLKICVFRHSAVACRPSISGPCTTAPPRPVSRSRPAGDPELVKQAVKLLSEASSPMIFAGGGVWWSQAYDELRQLVERTGIPFYTTPMSRGLLPDDHEMSFPAARSGAFRQADVVLVVGTRFNWMMTFGNRIAAGSKVIQIDIHGAELGHNRSIDIGIEGDAKAVLQQMIDEANRAGFESKANTKWIETLRQADLDRRERVAPLENSDQQPIHPLRLCKELREVMDRDAIYADANQQRRAERLVQYRQSQQLWAVGLHGRRASIRHRCKNRQTRQTGNFSAWRWLTGHEYPGFRHGCAP